MKNLLLLLIVAMSIMSCAEDDPSNELAGSYVLEYIEMTDCASALLADWSNTSESCIRNNDNDGDYCRLGRLIIAEDGTVSSSITTENKSDLITLTLPILSINGQGTVTTGGNFANICLASCVDYEISGTKLVRAYTSTVGCNVTIRLVKE